MKELTPLLEKLAEKLGTTVEKLWDVLLNQVQVQIGICEIWMNVAIFLFGGLALIFFVLGIFGLMWRWEGEGIFFSFLGSFIMTALSGVIYGVNYTTLLTLKLNPEYWALQEILKHL